MPPRGKHAAHRGNEEEKMRSFFVSMPPNGKPPSAVLLYLHGVGEAFDPIDEEEKKRLSPQQLQQQLVSRLGARNLFNHGIPRLFYEPSQPRIPGIYNPLQPRPCTLPFEQFLTIAPQMFGREHMNDRVKVDQMMESARAIAAKLVEEPKIAIMGFSRGGLAAFQWLAGHEDVKDVKVIVSMDAATSGKPTRDELAAIITNIKKPFWAFFTDYPDSESRQSRITKMHENIKNVDDLSNAWRVWSDGHPDSKSLAAPPTTGGRYTTKLQTAGSNTEKHNAVCAEVTGSNLVYDWILKTMELRS
jgi:pimeloyl-ACP methyl ester carboxylesterase